MVAKQKVGKFMVGKADETANFQQSYRSGNEVSQMLEFIKSQLSGMAHASSSAQNHVSQIGEKSEKFEISKSPQTKRKGSALEKGKKSDNESLSSEEEKTPSKAGQLKFLIYFHDLLYLYSFIKKIPKKVLLIN
jgi:hypothetical protein